MKKRKTTGRAGKAFSQQKKGTSETFGALDRPFELYAMAATESGSGGTPPSSSSSLDFCGPDITNWFVQFTLAAIASNQGKIISALLHFPGSLAPGSKASALGAWAVLVRPNGIWDLKVYLKNIKTAHCPTLPKCELTVSLSGFCVRFDMPGNIFYGIVGLILGFGALESLAGADLAQRIWTGHADPPEDQAAIKVGFASVVNNTITFESLAAAIKARINKLATSPECKLCDEGPWTPPATNP